MTANVRLVAPFKRFYKFFFRKIQHSGSFDVHLDKEHTQMRKVGKTNSRQEADYGQA